MKIYVVTKGCYSDYHIITATTDKELAYKIKDKFSTGYSWGQAEVEVFENAEIYTSSCYFMRFDAQGHVIELYKKDDEYDYKENCGTDIDGNFYVSVVTDDEVAAIKIGAERRAMYLAKKTGVC